MHTPIEAGAPSRGDEANGEPILIVDDICVGIATPDGHKSILREVSLELCSGQMHGVVGETGSGKTMTGRAILGILPRGCAMTSGEVRLRDRSLVGLDEDEWAAVRGRQMSMIFQNPRTALHPLISVEDQMSNVLVAHFEMTADDRRDRIREYLGLAGIPDTDRVASAYPHELSGGLAQRVVIATALLCDPEVVIADEPTTGLDATVQREILDQIADLQRELSLSVLMITHDLAIVAQYCESVSVMHDGTVVEDGPMRQILGAPAHGYTKHLLAASRLEDFGERA